VSCARTQIRVASDPALAAVTGRYFVRERQAKPPRAALDAAAARRLWEVSERIADGATDLSETRIAPTNP